MFYLCFVTLLSISILVVFLSIAGNVYAYYIMHEIEEILEEQE